MKEVGLGDPGSFGLSLGWVCGLWAGFGRPWNGTGSVQGGSNQGFVISLVCPPSEPGLTETRLKQFFLGLGCLLFLIRKYREYDSTASSWLEVRKNGWRWKLLQGLLRLNSPTEN